MGMTDRTPYRERPATEVERERQCMADIFRKAGEVNYIFEAFGGTGVTARVLREQFPKAYIEATDLDSQCVDQYNATVPEPARAWCTDAVEFSRTKLPSKIPWGASLDYNKFTIMDLRGQRPKPEAWKMDLFQEVARRGPKWIELTDSAIRYLHLNWERYDARSRTIDAYVAVLRPEFKRYGYRIAAHSHHSAATYLLLEKK